MISPPSMFVLCFRCGSRIPRSEYEKHSAAHDASSRVPIPPNQHPVATLGMTTDVRRNAMAVVEGTDCSPAHRTETTAEVRHITEVVVSKPAESGSSASVPQRATRSPGERDPRSQSFELGSRRKHGPTKRMFHGSDQSQGFFQNAAVAQTEGRTADARKLLEQAISVGGGAKVYTALFKLERDEKRWERAREVGDEGTRKFPTYYELYEIWGQMERQLKNYGSAMTIFRSGLSHAPQHPNLLWGLGQVLVQVGTPEYMREAKTIIKALDERGKLNRNDGLYLRIQALSERRRASTAFDFFNSFATRVAFVAVPKAEEDTTDLVVTIDGHELSESFGVNGSFLVRCFERVLREVDVQRLQKYLSELGSEAVLKLDDGSEVLLNPSLGFVVASQRLPNVVRDRIMAILGEQAEAIVPIDDTQLSPGRTNQPIGLIIDLLGQYLGRRDLYSMAGPVVGRRFFGRERLLLRLKDEVVRGQFLGIYGLRKIGKTSLIFQLRDEKLKGDAVAYADIQGSTAIKLGDCAPLYHELERDLYLRLRESHPDLANTLRLGRIERYSELGHGIKETAMLFAEDIRVLLDQLAERRVGSLKRLVIILDELEHMLPVGGRPGINGYLEFFSLLRGLAQTPRYEGLLSSVVVAANASISEQGYWNGRENPVFALYKSISLPPLSREECTQMINVLGRGMSVHWDDAAVHLILDEAGGHPFITRALCSWIATENQARPLRVTKEMVQSQIRPFIRERRDLLDQILKLLRANFPDEENHLEHIALGTSARDIPDTVASHLLNYHLIAPNENGQGYRMTLNLLRRHLRRRAGVSE